MKKTALVFLLVGFSVFRSVAQPPPPPPPGPSAAVPIDTDVALLLTTAALYGAWKLRKQRLATPE